MKKFLTIILIIALFCSNVTPAFAKGEVILPENSADISIVESDSVEDITEILDVSEATISEKSIVEEITISENEILKEREKAILDNHTYIMDTAISANSIAEKIEEKQLTLKIEGIECGKYSTWTDVINAIEENADITKEYMVEINDSIFLRENLTIPSGIGSLIIKGKAQDKKVTFGYTGDIKLYSKVCFDSIELKAQKYNNETAVYEDYLSQVVINGKELVVQNCDIKFASLKGNNKSIWKVSNSNIYIEKAVSGVGQVELEDSVLQAEVINVTKVLSMKSSVVESEGRITLQNIISNDEKNRIIYQDNTNGKCLNINGNITSQTSEDEEKVLWKNNIEGVETKEIVKVRKNAITLQVNSLEESGYEKSSFLANIPKAGAAWFVIGSEWQVENDKMVRVIKETVYKVNTKLYSGNANNNVILFSSKEETEDRFMLESSFATLQEALNEIDKIGDSSQYYRILLNNSEQNAASFANKSLIFPTKTKGVLIRKSSGIQEGNLYFKGNLTLKCNVKFEDIIFRNNGKCNVSLGKYTLHLKNCYSNDSAEMTEFQSITGNGTRKTSGIILEDTIVKVNGTINNIGQVQFLSNAEGEVAAQEAEEIIRLVPAYPELRANGKINIGTVIVDAEGKITGIAKIVRKDGIITKITPDINIDVEILSDEYKNLYLELQEKTDSSYQILDLSALDLEEWKQEKGIPVIKALGSKYHNVYLFQNSQCKLIKQAGYYTYYEAEENISGVELSFETEGKEEKIYCYSLNDAMMEINNQKVKRDYVVTLKKEAEEISLKFPKNIKFPMKKYVNSLIIQGENQEENVKLGYLGNLTFTSPVVIKNISFVQMMKKNGEYKSVKEVKEDYPGIVTIKTSGFDLEFRGKSDFDTPIKIDGGKKGSLILSGILNTYTNDFEKSDQKGVNVIYGMITNIHELSLSYQELSLREAGNGRNTGKYIASNNKITNLYLEDESIFEITGVFDKNSLNVQTVSLINSEISIKGNGNFRDVTLTGEREAVIYVDKNFNITGKLEIDTDNGYLKTRRKGKGKEPYLNISGKVYLEEGRNPLYIGVFYETGAGEFMQEKYVDFRNDSTASAQLLSAKYAEKDHFRPMEENYPGGEYSETNTNGYKLEKKGARIYVYAGEK